MANNRTVSLAECVKIRGLRRTAEELGCTDGAIRQAITNKRSIAVVLTGTGRIVGATEERPFPCRVNGEPMLR